MNHTENIKYRPIHNNTTCILKLYNHFNDMFHNSEYKVFYFVQPISYHIQNNYYKIKFDVESMRDHQISKLEIQLPLISIKRTEHVQCNVLYRGNHTMNTERNMCI